MNYNSKILAHARGILSDVREKNEETAKHRREKLYHDVPEIDAIDRKIAVRMLDMTKKAISGNTSTVASTKDEVLNLRMKKAELMTKNGFPQDYLEDIFTCPICKDTGYVNGKVCSCLEKIYKKELTKQLSGLLRTGNESFDRFSLDYYYGPDREHMQKVLQLCREFADVFPNASNLILSGAPGLGKTFLSACIAREIADRGYSVIYDTAITCLGAFERQQFAKDLEQEQAASRVNSMLECDLMILDDLGTEQPTPATVSALYNLINTRLNNGKITVINTNLNSDSIKKRYTPAICSRLDGYFITIPFVGTDIRQKLKGKEQ